MANNKETINKKTAQKATEEPAKSEFVLGTINYILIVTGIVLLGLGYILLSGGGSDDPNIFNSEMFNSRRLVVAPLMIVAGLVVEICAIMYRPKNRKNSEF